MLDPDRFITNYQSTLAKKKYAAAQKPALPNNSFSHSPSITTTGNWLERAALGTISRQKLAEFDCSLSW